MRNAPVNDVRLSHARFEREDGQGLAEYGLILALVSIAAIVSLGLMATAITGVFGDVTDAL